MTFEDFGRLNEPDELKEFQRQKDDSFKVVAPQEDKAKVLTYGITDGLFDASRSTLTVRGQKDFNNPPIAVDDTGTAKQGETSILVDALANDRDLDGDRASLSITKFIGDGVSAEGTKLRIQLRPQARVVPYVIEDADGAVAMALIYVPAGSNGLPFVVDGKTIKMGADSTVKVSLADYVSRPTGGTVAVTSPDTVSTSPADNLQFEVTSATELSLTSTRGYVGPAALMLQVTNSTGQGDKAAQAAYVTVPVQIGPDIPVLRCPDHEVLLAADGPARTFDISRLVQGVVADGARRGHRAVRGVVGPGRRPRRPIAAGLRRTPGRAAGPARRPGRQRPVRSSVKAKGSAESFKIRVRVTSSPPARHAARRAHRGTRRRHEPDRQPRAVPRQPAHRPAVRDQPRPTVVSGAGMTRQPARGCQLTVTATDSRARRGPRGGLRSPTPRAAAPPSARSSSPCATSPTPMAAPTAVADRVLGSSARVDFRPPAYDGGLPILGATR